MHKQNRGMKSQRSVGDKKPVRHVSRIHSCEMSPVVSVFLFVVCLQAAVCGEDGTFGLLARSFEKCGGRSDLGTCLRVRAVGLLDRALHSGPIEINDFLSLTPDSGVQMERTGRALTETEIEAGLPEAKELKDAALDGMIAEKMSNFFQSRTFKFTMPTEVTQEGRKKKKDKGMGMVMALFFSMMIQMAMAKIAVLAGKALLIGKLALVLSAIIGLKKLVSGGGESHQVVYAEHGGHSWGRSQAGESLAHEMAYSAQARANSSQ